MVGNKKKNTGVKHVHLEKKQKLEERLCCV